MQEVFGSMDANKILIQHTDDAKPLRNNDILLILFQEAKKFISQKGGQNIFQKLFCKQTAKGLYLHGKTGTGKTTAMNNFFENCETSRKINIHFHDYFLDISRLLTKYTLKQIVRKIADKVDLLCFDEFYIESITDGILLQELLSSLINCGVTICLTSNFTPTDLYKNGFNRDRLFPKFSDFITQNFSIIPFETQHDYREVDMKSIPIILYENSKIIATQSALIKIDETRSILAKNINPNLNLAIFEYSELFQKHRSVADYIFLARHYDEIHIENFTELSLANEDEAIRFRNFVDVLYIRKVILKIYTAQNGINISNILADDLLTSIKFKRVQSRLKEMSWVSYVNSNARQKVRKWNNDAREFLDGL